MEKLQAGLMCSDYLSLSFGCPLLVLPPGVSPGFLASTVLNRIRGFRDLNSVNLYQQQPVFLRPLLSPYSMYCTLSSTVCTCKTCQQSKPPQLLTPVRPGL